MAPHHHQRHLGRRYWNVIQTVRSKFCCSCRCHSYRYISCAVIFRWMGVVESGWGRKVAYPFREMMPWHLEIGSGVMTSTSPSFPPPLSPCLRTFYIPRAALPVKKPSGFFSCFILNNVYSQPLDDNYSSWRYIPRHTVKLNTYAFSQVSAAHKVDMIVNEFPNRNSWQWCKRKRDLPEGWWWHRLFFSAVALPRATSISTTRRKTAPTWTMLLRMRLWSRRCQVTPYVLCSKCCWCCWATYDFAGFVLHTVTSILQKIYVPEPLYPQPSHIFLMVVGLVVGGPQRSHANLFYNAAMKPALLSNAK